MPSGQLTSYSATLPHKRTVTDRIIMADPYSVVTLNALGMDASAKFKFVNAPGKIYEWLEDTYAARNDVVNTGLASDSTTTTFSATDGSKFVIGDVVLVDSEYMWVSAISTNTVTVTRNYGGTQATHANSSVAYIVGNNRLEGAAADVATWTQPTTGYNYSWIEQRTIEISRTDSRLNQYGITDVVNREIDKKMDELMMLLCLQAYHGQRKAGTGTTPRAAGGLDTFITTNPNALSNTPALIQKHIEDEVQDCWNFGGNPRLILCGAWAKRKIADFYRGYVRTERSETMGGISIDKIVTPLGIELDVVVDRHCPTNKLYLLDPDYVGYMPIDEFFYEELGKTKDTADGGFGQVVGEYGIVVAYEKAHSIISGFSTSQ